MPGTLVAVALTTAHLQFALLGLLIGPLGFWWLRHPVRRTGDDKTTLQLNRIDRLAAVVFGGALAFGGTLLVLGSLIGAIFWGIGENHGGRGRPPRSDAMKGRQARPR
jgi:predicted ABC-type sugar transport system permease subunit